MTHSISKGTVSLVQLDYSMRVTGHSILTRDTHQNKHTEVNESKLHLILPRHKLYSQTS